MFKMRWIQKNFLNFQKNNIMILNLLKLLNLKRTYCYKMKNHLSTKQEKIKVEKWINQQKGKSE